MPAARVIEILAEIGEIAHNPRVKELAAELGILLAANIDNAEIASTNVTDLNASVTHLKERTTAAILDTEATLEDRITDLRTAIMGLTALYRRRIDTLETTYTERDQVITDKIHALSNHMMAVENKIAELAEAVTMLLDDALDQSAVNDSDSHDQQ